MTYRLDPGKLAACKAQAPRRRPEGQPGTQRKVAPAGFKTSLDETFVKALVARSPIRIDFRDAGHASDAMKITIEQLVKALSPHTELKTL